MIKRGRIRYLWDEDYKRTVNFFGHRTNWEERWNDFNDVLSHYRLEAFVESTGKPLGPGAFRLGMWNKVALISSGVGMLHSAKLSSSEMTGGIRSSKWSGKLTFSAVKCCLKLSRKCCLISPVSVIQTPSSDLIASILFCRRLMMVDRWKNLVFLSLSLSHSSLDFSRHKTSLFKSHSLSSAWRAASDLPLLFEGLALWTLEIFWIRVLILTWQRPKTSLFHLRRAWRVASCFLHNLVKLDPMTSSFRAFSMTTKHRGSRIQATSNRKGLWAKAFLGAGIQKERCVVGTYNFEVGYGGFRKG